MTGAKRPEYHASMQDIEPGFYWIRTKIGPHGVGVAEWDGEFWLVPGIEEGFKFHQMEIIAGPLPEPPDC